MTSDGAGPTDSAPAGNLLATETSPYLLQHADNPVAWRPWGDKALHAARDEDKPIFLSIGYSACHWCHVMAHESFEDQDIAAYLNRHFISIKVDREERPDIDDIYMRAVQMMTGGGGWPLTVFLTPNLEPFHGGTYFPPEDRHGMPGFMTVLGAVVKAWEEQPGNVRAAASQLRAAIERSASPTDASEGGLPPDLPARGAEALRRSFDPRHGGFGQAPKFPPVHALGLLLREHRRTGDTDLLDMAVATLRHMARGGIRDHLGGGFHRYSVDAEWLVPHFEKMLYDNAQLARAFLECHQVTGDAWLAEAARDALDYVVRDMASPGGGFLAAEDADSEGREGVFYLWTRQEVLDVLGDEDGGLFCQRYNVRPEGNFASHEPYHRNQNILHVTEPLDTFAGRAGADPAGLAERLAAMRETLRLHRERRTRPGCDTKVIVSWNALMVSALAKGYWVLGDTRYLDAARNAAEAITGKIGEDGPVPRTLAGASEGFLDDYAFLVQALVDLYGACFDTRWLRAAERIADNLVARFWDTEDGGFYGTAAGAPDVIVRTKPVFDGAEPSGNAMAALGLLAVGRLLDRPDLEEKARETARVCRRSLERSPEAHLRMLWAVDVFTQPRVDVAIAAPEDGDGDARALLDAVRSVYMPGALVALGKGPDGAGADLPMLRGRFPVDGHAAAYVCIDRSCRAPVTDPAELRELLTGNCK